MGGFYVFYPRTLLDPKSIWLKVCEYASQKRAFARKMKRLSEKSIVRSQTQFTRQAICV